MAKNPLQLLARAGRRPEAEESEETDAAPAQDPDAERHATSAEMAQIVVSARKIIDNGPEAKLAAAVAGFEMDDAQQECPEGFDEAAWEAAKHVVEQAGEDATDALLVGTVYRLMGGPLPESDEDGDPEGGVEDMGHEAKAKEHAEAQGDAKHAAVKEMLGGIGKPADPLARLAAAKKAAMSPKTQQRGPTQTGARNGRYVLLPSGRKFDMPR